MGMPTVECEQMIDMGGKIGWSTCGALPTNYVTFSRTSSMWLCADHETEAAKDRAAVVPQGNDTKEKA